MQAGLDSLGAVDLRNAISSACGVELPATAVFDYPTLQVHLRLLCHLVLLLRVYML
jgi:acyl carrier protein